MLIWISDQWGQEWRRVLRFVHAGLALSVSLGDGSYSDGAKTVDERTASEYRSYAWSNQTFEAALFRVDENGHDIGKDWIKLTEYDDVAGHLPMSLLPKLLTILYGGEETRPSLRAARIVETVRTAG